MLAHDDLDEPVRLSRRQRIKPGHRVALGHDPKQITRLEPAETTPGQPVP